MEPCTSTPLETVRNVIHSSLQGVYSKTVCLMVQGVNSLTRVVISCPETTWVNQERECSRPCQAKSLGRNSFLSWATNCQFKSSMSCVFSCILASSTLTLRSLHGVTATQKLHIRLCTCCSSLIAQVDLAKWFELKILCILFFFFRFILSIVAPRCRLMNCAKPLSRQKQNWLSRFPPLALSRAFVSVMECLLVCRLVQSRTPLRDCRSSARS